MELKTLCREILLLYQMTYEQYEERLSSFRHGETSDACSSLSSCVVDPVFIVSMDHIDRTLTKSQVESEFQNLMNKTDIENIKLGDFLNNAQSGDRWSVNRKFPQLYRLDPLDVCFADKPGVHWEHESSSIADEEDLFFLVQFQEYGPLVLRRSYIWREWRRDFFEKEDNTGRTLRFFLRIASFGNLWQNVNQRGLEPTRIFCIHNEGEKFISPTGLIYKYKDSSGFGSFIVTTIAGRKENIEENDSICRRREQHRRGQIAMATRQFRLSDTNNLNVCSTKGDDVSNDNCTICQRKLQTNPEFDTPEEEQAPEQPTEPELCCLGCGHVFHKHCIYEWLGTGNTCPLCKFIVGIPLSIVNSC